VGATASLFTGLGLVGGGVVGGAANKGPLASIFHPRTQPLPKVPPMPDQLALDQAAQRKAALEASRQTGRASTILSSGTDTGDRLGP